MKCKYCDAKMARWGGYCPVCGKYNANENGEEPTRQDLSAPEEAGPSDELKQSKRIAMMSGCVALLAVLATVLFFAVRGGWDVGGLFDWLKPRENSIHYRENYTVKDKKVTKKHDVAVATVDGVQLTNAQLQIYYWNEVYNFIGENYYYLSYMGLDSQAPLNEQKCYLDTSLTWQQYFLENAINTWHSNVALAKQAEKNNFTMPEEYRSELDTLEADLQESVTKGGYASLDAMVQESFGAGVTFADYQEYLELYYQGYSYFEHLYEQIDPSMEDIEAYYDENKDTLTQQGVKKDGSYTVDVRHILVLIDNIAAEMDKDAESTQTDEKFTEEHWQACLEAAQRIYDEWLAGEQTEEHFGELANKYSDDNNGEVTDGGIYTFVSEGDMVEDFNTWCFTEGRKPGDTDIVKTEFGYHVMYFVGSEETWITYTRSAYIADQSNQLVSEAVSQYTIDINYKKIVLGEVEL